MAAEHWSILFKKHLVWTDTMDWQCHLPTKGCNGQSEMGVWGAVPSANISHHPHPSQDPNTAKKTKQNKTLNKHFWLIFGGTNWKQIKANGHWDFPHLVFSRACSQMETHFLPWPMGAPTSSLTHSFGPKWTVESNWDLRAKDCPLGHPGSINISKDNP